MDRKKNWEGKGLPEGATDRWSPEAVFPAPRRYPVSGGYSDHSLLLFRQIISWLIFWLLFFLLFTFLLLVLQMVNYSRLNKGEGS